MALFTLGILLFLLIAADIIKTTLSTRGGGMLTNAVTRSVWALFFRAAGRQGRSGVLQYAGQFVVLSVLLSWILGLWASLFLLFASHPGSIVDDATKLPADLWETFYYAGFTLSTLGVGDYAAAADGWRVLTSAAAFCGLTFITAAITYIVPVLSAVSLQNQLSLLVSSMGRTPQEILVNSWNGADFSSFYDNVPELRQMLVQHTLNHHAYPVIQCFHNCDAGKNVVPAVVTLNEVLRLLQSVSAEIPQDRQTADAGFGGDSAPGAATCQLPWPSPPERGRGRCRSDAVGGRSHTAGRRPRRHRRARRAPQAAECLA